MLFENAQKTSSTSSMLDVQEYIVFTEKNVTLTVHVHVRSCLAPLGNSQRLLM